ncbi:SIMPL domain-containing protein [Allosphingosinicella humi]|jgi:uncharacterized protein YggE
MIRTATLAALLALSLPAAAMAQEMPMHALSGTRLDVVATGEVTRVPDIARINAGVVTQAQTASAAIAQNAQQMNRVIAALKKAGIAERDIQTSSVSLYPDYRYAENQPPVLTGYRANNEVTVRFRDIATSGSILDALVAEGANQINGPTLSIDKPEAALDEARQKALATAQARASIYARALGKTVKRILSISESGAAQPPYPIPMMAMKARDSAETAIVPGEQTLSTTLSVTFELD